MVAISGNTYPVKDQLKALGAKWNPDQKAWMVDETKADQARSIVSGASATSTAPLSRPYRATKCRVCGVDQGPRNARGYYAVRIYKSGECQDCFEERKMGY